MQHAKKKILIADGDKTLAKSLKKALPASEFHIESAEDGFEALSKIETFAPHLVFIELMLPKIHGIEIARKIKTDPRTKETGALLMTTQGIVQNYQAALYHHCDFFFQKPLKIERCVQLIHTFFEKGLQPEPFKGIESKVSSGTHCYLPKMHTPDAYIRFWGTRGSNPVSGPEYVRFGGNTCCLEVRCKEDLVIIDAGTGIRPFGAALNGSAQIKNIHILMSHTHWDHLAGFPFFAPLYDKNCRVTVWTPIGYERTTKELFNEMLAYAYFPVRLDDIQAQIHFKDILVGDPLSIGKIKIQTHYAYHPGPTVCFKIAIGSKTFGYATDNEFLMGYHGSPNQITKTHPEIKPYQSMIDFFTGVDFLIHEAQYTPQEYQTKIGWGHSSISNAAVLIKQAEISEWIITHHDPKHTDMDLLHKIQMQYDILDDCKLDVRPRMAFDQLTIPL